MIKQEYDLVMNGSGLSYVDIPPGMNFVSIINNSDNTIEIYQDKRTAADSNVKDTLVTVPYFTQLTVPLRRGTDVTFIYSDGGAIGTKKAVVIFCSENLNITGVLGNPSSGGSVTLQADGVGLARQSQLPLALGTSGGLKVEVQGTTPVSIAGQVEVMNDTGNPIPVGITGVLPALSAGTNNIGDVDVLTLPSLPTGANTIGKVNIAPSGIGGFTIARVKAAATTNATNLKASGGTVFGFHLYNNTAAAKFLKLYNKATAPTVGTDTPVMTVPIPPNGVASFSNAIGLNFVNGIAYAITGAIGDTDTTATAVDDVTGALFYI